MRDSWRSRISAQAPGSERRNCDHRSSHIFNGGYVLSFTALNVIIYAKSMQTPWRRSDTLRKRDDGPVYLTQAGFDRLRQEVSRLEAKLPAMISEVQFTRSHGDLSDNAEYKEAKVQLRRTQARIQTLKRRIARAVVIQKDPSLSGSVQLGSVVTLEVDGKRVMYEIVGSLESDPLHGRISHVSPLGAALLGHRPGERVAIQTPRGEMVYVVVGIHETDCDATELDILSVSKSP